MLQKEILIIDRERLDGVFRSAYASKILRLKKNYRIKILTEKKKNSLSNNVYKKLGLNNFIYISNQNKNYKNLYLIFISFFHSIFLLLKILFSTQYTLSKFHYNGVKIGDLLVDHIARYSPYFFNKSYLNLYTFKIIYHTLFKILFIKRYIKNNNIKLVITTSYSYASISSIAIRVALSLKKKVLIVAGSEYKIFKNYRDGLKGFDKLFSKKFLSFFKVPKNRKSSIKYFSERLNGSGIKSINSRYDRDVFRAFYKKKNLSKRELYKLLKLDDLSKPICTFALHAFRDANHLFGNLIFESFYDEFLETINFLKKNNNFYWLVKVHPSAKQYGENGLVEKILKEYKIDNVKIIPEFISTKTIINLSDKLVTSRGTIALEFASIGKKPIITANTYYKNFGFTINPKSKKQYFNNLIDLKFPKKLNSSKSIIAKELLYFIKVILTRNNIYNFTDPAREIGNRQFINNLNKKLPTLYNKKKFLFKLYNEMMNKI
jgi:hypothetical protein